MGFRVIGRLRRHLCGRRRGDAFVARAPAEDGFSLIETAVALGLVFTVMLGLLASLTAGIRGVSTGRQRTGAVALAKEIVERARGDDFDDVGHDLSDPGGLLAADPEVTQDANGDWVFEPDAATGTELLVGSGSALFATHEWNETRDGVGYTVRAYVTEVPTAIGEDYKRLTIHASWDRGQYDEAAVPSELKVSTFLSKFSAVPGPPTLTGAFPYGEGAVDANSGAVTITGTLSGIDLALAQIFQPVVRTATEADLVIDTVGLARSARSTIGLNSGTPSGCSVSGTSASCIGVKAETAADNDGATALPLQDVAGPLGDPGGTLLGGSVLSLFTGASGSVTSKSSADSCIVVGCTAGPVGDGDGLAYGEGSADGPASMNAVFEAGIVSGTLVDSAAAGSATATIDQDAVSASSFIDSVGRLVVPALDLVTLDAGPVGFTSAVKVSGVDVTGIAQAGPTAGPPQITGDPVTVSMYETTGLGGAYVDVSFTPGNAISETATATFDVVDSLLGVTNTVTIETTVRSGEPSTPTQTNGQTIVRAEANLTNWFIVQVRLVVQDLLGATLADLTIEADYGRLGVAAEVRG